MTITFQKRQKEMKRLEKQREKAEKRAQRKQAKRDGTTVPEDDIAIMTEPNAPPFEPEAQN
jgi:hypothetical protein